MKIYTKTGDKGTTALVGGERTSKDDLRVEAYGTVDELSAHIAFLRDSMDTYEVDLELYRKDLETILSDLMTVAALLATSKESSFRVPELRQSQIESLEGRIDHITAELTPIDKFTLPGGHPLVSWSHICRTVCRRAERTGVKAATQYEISQPALTYLNRLSDYLYTLGRKLSDEFNVKETYWIVDK